MDLIIEVPYVGSADTIYDKDQRLGASGEHGRVIVDSDAQGKSPISVILKETGATTGVFRANIMLSKCASDATCAASQANEAMTNLAGTITIPVYDDGDTIEVTYSDADPSAKRTATIPLDPDGPSFSAMSPASGTSGREDEPTVSFEITDTASMISTSKDAGDSIAIFAKLYATDDKTALTPTVGIEDATTELHIKRKDLTVSSITDGYSASVTLDEGTDDDELDGGNSAEYHIHWWALGMDQAGNVGASDQNTKSDSVCNPEGLDVATLKASDLTGAGCDPFIIRVDAAAPTFDKAETGVWHDGDNEQPYTGTDTKVTNKGAKNTSVVARFSEDLDCDSVSADDFTVGGSTPSGATCKGANVYLDVDELATNAKPKVTVASGAVTDKAGNAIAKETSQDATDGIPAQLTVTVTGTGEGDRPVTKDKVTITISSDERLKGNPHRHHQHG